MGEQPDNVRGRQRKKGNADGSKEYRIKPTDYRELKDNYNEYVTHCQQTYHTIPDFHNFMVNMAKFGFHSWQEKNKR